MLEHTLVGRILRIALYLTIVLLIAGLCGVLGVALVAGNSPHGMLAQLQGASAGAARLGLWSAVSELAVVIVVMCIPEPVLRRWTYTPDAPDTDTSRVPPLAS